MMVVHSYLYYVLDQQLITDHMWQALANELVELQSKTYPMLGWYDSEFKDWDGSTGYHLPRDAWVIAKANYLLSRRSPHTIERKRLVPQ